MPLPIKSAPLTGAVVKPVPPNDTGTGATKLIVPVPVMGPPVSPVPVEIEMLLANPAMAPVVVRLVVPAWTIGICSEPESAVATGRLEIGVLATSSSRLWYLSVIVRQAHVYRSHKSFSSDQRT